jgi:hypothetical protein
MKHVFNLIAGVIFLAALLVPLYVLLHFIVKYW